MSLLNLQSSDVVAQSITVIDGIFFPSGGVISDRTPIVSTNMSYTGAVVAANAVNVNTYKENNIVHVLVKSLLGVSSNAVADLPITLNIPLDVALRPDVNLTFVCSVFDQIVPPNTIVPGVFGITTGGVLSFGTMELFRFTNGNKCGLALTFSCEYAVPA